MRLRSKADQGHLQDAMKQPERGQAQGKAEIERSGNAVADAGVNVKAQKIMKIRRHGADDQGGKHQLFSKRENCRGMGQGEWQRSL